MFPVLYYIYLSTRFVATSLLLSNKYGIKRRFSLATGIVYLFSRKQGSKTQSQSANQKNSRSQLGHGTSSSTSHTPQYGNNRTTKNQSETQTAFNGKAPPLPYTRGCHCTCNSQNPCAQNHNTRRRTHPPRAINKTKTKNRKKGV